MSIPVIKTYSNNMQALVTPISGTDAVTILVLVKVGSRHEDPRVNGIAHFIEHLLFKGTERRPTTLKLTQDLDRIGAQYNAFTSKDHTAFYIKAAKKHLPLLFDILSDMIFHPLFDGEEIEREKGVIIEEIRMYKDTPMRHVDDLFELALFGDNSLGRNIAGEPENIQSITREDIKQYFTSFYHPHNMIFSIAGGVTEDEAFSLIEKHFGASIAQTTPETKTITIDRTTPTLHLEQKDIEQMHLILGFPGISYRDPAIYALDTLHVLFGGMMSSRLFIQIRERLGLCYYIRSGVTLYQEAGAFSISAGVDRSRLEQAVKEILRQIRLLMADGVTQKEVEDAKTHLAGRLVLEYEDSEHVANWMADQAAFYPEILSSAQQLEKIAAVTREDVQEVIRRIFNPSLTTLAIIGPMTDGDRTMLEKIVHSW